MMTGDARAQAVYASIQNNAAFAKTTDAERQSILASLRSIFTADLGYITGYAQVNPGSLETPAGAAVITSGSPTTQSGSVTTPTLITGLGTLS